MSLTSRHHGGVRVDERPHVMRVVLKGPGSDPIFILLVQICRDELELYDRALRRPGQQTALILLDIVEV